MFAVALGLRASNKSKDKLFLHEKLVKTDRSGFGDDGIAGESHPESCPVCEDPEVAAPAHRV